ncbi:MAG: hypothetical protein M0033_10670, partial [Nitrospiraceae bacterium]|nr:hypothetical protein [Nitrospiraceae bacterium]
MTALTIDRTPPVVKLPDGSVISGVQTRMITLSDKQLVININDDPRKICAGVSGLCGAVSGIKSVRVADYSTNNDVLAPYVLPVPVVKLRNYPLALAAGTYVLEVRDAAGNLTSIPLRISGFSLEVSTADSHVEIDRDSGTFTGTLHIKASSDSGLLALGLVNSNLTSTDSKTASGETSLEADLNFGGNIDDYFTKPNTFGAGFTDMLGRIVWQPVSLYFGEQLGYKHRPDGGRTSDFTVPVLDLVAGEYPMLPGAIMSVYVPTLQDMQTRPFWWWNDGNGYYGAASYPPCSGGGQDCRTYVTLPRNEAGRQDFGKVQVRVKTWGNTGEYAVAGSSVVADRDMFVADKRYCPGMESFGYACYTDHAATNTTIHLKRYVETAVSITKVAPTEAVSCASDPYFGPACNSIYDSIPNVLSAGPGIYGLFVNMGAVQDTKGAMVPSGSNVMVQLPDGVSISFGAHTVFTPGILNFSYASVDNYPGFKNLSGNLSFSLETKAAFDHASITIPYDPAGLTPSQESAIRIYRITDNGDYIALGATVDTVNKKVQSADMAAFGRIMVAAPRYINPQTAASAAYAVDKPELEFTAEGVLVGQSVYDTGTPEGAALLAAVTANGSLMGNIYKLGPQDPALAVPGTLKMHYDAAAAEAAGISSVALYHANSDGTGLYKLSGTVLDPVNHEAAAEVWQPSGLYLLIGSTAADVSDKTPPAVAVSYGAPKYAQADKLYISTLTPVSLARDR